MVWDVPWMVAGNVKHSANVARRLAYVAAGGREGVVTAEALEVRALATPGPSVRVLPGAAAILNRAAPYEAYTDANLTDDVVAIAPTGGSPRTDLIVARVEDPFQPGAPWSPPTAQNIESGNVRFTYSRVVSGVSASARPRDILEPLGYSAIPLAFVTLPANTSVVQQSHIADLRMILGEQTGAGGEPVMVTAATTDANPKTLTGTEWGVWMTELTTTIAIPAWATHMTCRIIVGGVKYGAQGTNGGSGWKVGGEIRVQSSTAGEFPATQYNLTNEGGVDRTTLLTAGRIKVPRAARGQASIIRLQGTRTAISTTQLVADGGTTSTLEVMFHSAPESSL